MIRSFRKICYLLVFSLTAACLQAQAQSLYMPRNITNAYKAGTRSLDGRPGNNYWQNHGTYNITVTAMPPDRNIKGSEQITYTNNSPDTLKQLVFRLVLNVHKPGAPRYGGTDSSYLTSGIHVDKFEINGQAVQWPESAWQFTVQGIHLPQPLLPNDSVQLNIDWHYQISLKSGREGMIDSTTYYLAYFYPRVSVYDDYNGWDRLDFTDGQEFYNDFNDYTLNVTAPANYIVWATGTLQNPDEVLQPDYAKKLAVSMTSDAAMTIATDKDIESGKVTQQKTNTWQWKSHHITDVAVGISDHYDWDAGSVIVDPASGRRASVQAAYNDTAADFHQAVKNGMYALGWYSRNWPGVPYPFPKMTAFQGYADMEYPMMVNDATTDDMAFSRLVEDHEIAHTYFPFYMGINESRYAFMDEGWATTFELLIGRTETSVAAADSFYRKFRISRYVHDPSTEEDLPIITPSNVLRGIAYGINSYGKPSLSYLAVKDLLGDDLFKKCLHGYMDRWHGKHPIPWDYFYSFNNISGQNLDWFWENWFFSNNYVDLALKTVKSGKKGYDVTINNVGGMAIPVTLKLTYTDGSTDSIHKTPAIWKANEKVATIHINTNKKIKSAVLDNGVFMDANEADNEWMSK